MRLCFLAHGTSIHTQRWVTYFEDRGHALSLATFTPCKSLGGIPVCDLRALRPVSYSRANWHYLLRLPELRRFLVSVKPDLICAHFLSSYGLMSALTRPFGCPLVICIQGSDLLVFPRRSVIHSAVTRLALSTADLVVLPAAHMEDELKAFAGSGKSILTLQYGIDLRHFHPDHPNKGARQAVCFSNRSMVPAGGFETILKAAAVLRDRGSMLSFRLCDKRERCEPFRDMALKLRLSDTISFPGPIDPQQMPAALRSAAIYVSMVASDGASLSLMEAMACGLFPVVADNPANREWISDGINGFLVPVGRSDILADRLQEAWDLRALRRNAAHHNWQLVREKCDFSKNMEKIEAAFIRLGAS